MSSHVKNEKLISFIFGECQTAEYEKIRAHLDECEDCDILCKELNSILNTAQKVPTPEISGEVLNSIHAYADTKFPKQQKIKKLYTEFLYPLFSHPWIYAASLFVVIITSMIFLYPEKKDQNVLLLNDVKFDAAIVMLREEINEYSWELEEDLFTYLDEDILDLENKMNNFDENYEEYNYLF